MNDEAHHTHDEESEWNKFIRRLGSEVPNGMVAQFDFSATPRHRRIDRVVKSPLKGIAKGITEQRSDIASTRYQAYLAAGVERW